MKRLLGTFSGKFVRVAIAKESNDNFTKVDTRLDNQLADEYVAIGMKAPALLAHTYLDSGDEKKLFGYLKR